MKRENTSRFYIYIFCPCGIIFKRHSLEILYNRCSFEEYYANGSLNWSHKIIKMKGILKVIYVNLLLNARCIMWSDGRYKQGIILDRSSKIRNAKLTKLL